MFQMLDDELGPVSTVQFAFDHFRQHSDEKTTVGMSSSCNGREGNEADSFEVVFRLGFYLTNSVKQYLMNP